ncbi:MAG: hypothetical protein QM731_17715 [Chitinophagaceae bacterium]
MRKRTLLLLLGHVMCYMAIAQNTTQKYSYPVKPGSAEWKIFTTHQQMVESCAIPDKVAADLTTAALLESCLDYPLLAEIWAYNSPQKGIEALSESFKGLKLLIERTDVADNLLTVYRKLLATEPRGLPTLIEKGKLSFQISFIELVLAQQSVIDKTNEPTALRIKAAIGLAQDYKAANKDVFSAISTSYTTRLAGNLYRYHYKASFSKVTLDFLDSGLLLTENAAAEVNRVFIR